MQIQRSHVWRYLRALAAPALLWGLFVAVLVQLLPSWLRGDDAYDEKAIREWIEEARVFRDSLPEMVRDYLQAVSQARAVDPTNDLSKDPALQLKANRIAEHLSALGNPPTKMYPGQLPLFPIIYRLEVSFEEGERLQPIYWDSGVARNPSQYREFVDQRLDPRATIRVEYQVHAYNKRQHEEQAARERLRWVSALAIAGTILAIVWTNLVQRRERDRDKQRLEAQLNLDQAQRLQEDAERRLLEQRLATQAAEQQALELKSQLYASIGIMAGSYAHNIKNLLVRPNDLLRRCLETDGISHDQEHMLHEVRHTLGTVTERLQQILRTVRRDPSRPERTRIDVNDLLRDLDRTWGDLAKDKWKLNLHLELAPQPQWIEGDWSHLQQAVENLLFNARDATYEMRNFIRDKARNDNALSAEEKRLALIAAASWKGEIVIRSRTKEGRIIIEVRDNGIGMTEEVRRHCLETHYTTKRDNALYEGQNTGMGLGLSFVAVILQHHGATLQVDSSPQEGTLFRVDFPRDQSEITQRV
jgi:signal transduction histidine kinase